jgi:hypothetical protein
LCATANDGRANVANRPTRRAVEQAHAIAMDAEGSTAAAKLREARNAGVPTDDLHGRVGGILFEHRFQ